MREGTAIIVLMHPNQNWIDDDNRYWFPTHETGGVEIVVRKPRPRFFWVTMTGVEPEPFMIDVPVPDAVTGDKVIITLRWKGNLVDVTFNSHSVPAAIGPVDEYYRPPTAKGGAVKPEEVYLKKIDEMRLRAGLGTYYDFVMAAGILRHLLIDGNRLVDQLTRTRHDLKPVFEVIATELLDSKEIVGIDSEVEWVCIDPTIVPTTDPLRVKVNRDKFLGLQCLSFRGARYTVYNIIDSCANIRGGVHFSKPGTVQQSLIDLDEVVRFGGVEMSVSCIGAIVLVAARALDPLTQAIRRELGSQN